MIALIDGDILVWRCGAAAEEKWYDIYCEGEIIESFNKKKLADLYVGMDTDYFTTKVRYKALSRTLVRTFVDGLIESILKNTGATDYKIFLGGKINYRKYIDPEYKANRKGLHKPVHTKYLRKYLKEKHGAIEVEYIEADDAMGIEQIKCNKDCEDIYGVYTEKLNEGSIICTIDKDMKQIPGDNYNLITEESIHITEFEAWKNLYRQVLTGDVADNIIGLRGIGPKKADKILEHCTTICELKDACVEAYVNAGLEYKDFTTNYQLLYVLRSQEERDEKEAFVRGFEVSKEKEQRGKVEAAAGPKRKSRPKKGV